MWAVTLPITFSFCPFLPQAGSPLPAMLLLWGRILLKTSPDWSSCCQACMQDPTTFRGNAVTCRQSWSPLPACESRISSGCWSALKRFLSLDLEWEDNTLPTPLSWWSWWGWDFPSTDFPKIFHMIPVPKSSVFPSFCSLHLDGRWKSSTTAAQTIPWESASDKASGGRLCCRYPILAPPWKHLWSPAPLTLLYFFYLLIYAVIYLTDIYSA